VAAEQKLIQLIMGGDVRKELEINTTATTNKAARVLADMVGDSPKTIQSLLGLKPKPNYKTGKMGLVKARDYQEQPHSLIVIDEGSYINGGLLRHLIDSTKNTKVLVLGDRYQLCMPEDGDNPLVTPGGDPPIFMQGYPEARLTTVKRNEGPIEQLAAQYRNVVRIYSNTNIDLRAGNIDAVQAQEQIAAIVWPTIVPDNTQIFTLTGEQFQNRVTHDFVHNQGADQRKIVAWTNDRVIAYNAHARVVRGESALYGEGDSLITNNPIMQGKVFISTDSVVKVTGVREQGDRYGVFGTYLEIDGCVIGFCPDDMKLATRKMKAYGKAKQWTEYFEIKSQWFDLRPFHSCTVHKSQGSTYQDVYIDLYDIGRCSVASDVARMMNVAVSRAASRVFFYDRLPAKYGG
jgi:hypothetical protein